MAFIPQLQRPLYLCSLTMPEEGALEVVVRYALGSELPASPISREGWDLMSYPAISKPSAAYSIRFNSFVAFTVSDESFIRPDDQAIREGSQFVRFKQSSYLSYIESASYGEDVRPGMRFHYGVYCINQLVDVVTQEAPIIAYLGERAR